MQHNNIHSFIFCRRFLLNSGSQGRRVLLEHISAVIGEGGVHPAQVVSSSQGHIERQTTICKLPDLRTIVSSTHMPVLGQRENPSRHQSSLKKSECLCEKLFTEVILLAYLEIQWSCKYLLRANYVCNAILAPLHICFGKNSCFLV